MSNTDSPLDDLLDSIPQGCSDEELKQLISAYCHKQVIEARAELLDMLITTKKTDPVTLMELSVELRKTL